MFCGRIKYELKTYKILRKLVVIYEHYEFCYIWNSYDEKKYKAKFMRKVQ